jgi:hypothetical protein
MRPAFGYLFQQLALLINIHRWERIFGINEAGWMLTMSKIPT